jgi:hypothetical protein
MHNFTNDKLKRNAACKVIQATLTVLNDNLDCLVRNITELESEIVWDNFHINQQQGQQQQGVIVFGEIFEKGAITMSDIFDLDGSHDKEATAMAPFEPTPTMCLHSRTQILEVKSGTSRSHVWQRRTSDNNSP